MKLLVSALAVGVLVVVPAIPAAASCAPPPRESANPFTGIVVETSNHDRTATVRTDDGRTVTVNGAEGGPGVFTSVDRTYELGARYEFHPLNDSDPYRDNACTATRAISPAPGPTDANGSKPGGGGSQPGSGGGSRPAGGDRTVSSDGDQPVSSDSDEGPAADLGGGSADTAIEPAGAEAESDDARGVAIGWVAAGAIVGAAAIGLGVLAMRRRAKP